MMPCAPGQRIRVMAKSRAVILLTNQTLLHLDEGTVLTLTSVHADKPDRTGGARERLRSLRRQCR
ncbi:MAG: hypothetical protein ACREV1_19455 [Gammaproteobacteria bacterium]